MSETNPLDEKPLRRGYVRFVSDRALDRWIFGISPPPLQLLLKGFYGKDWARILSKRYGRSVRDIYSLTNGHEGLPRHFLQEIVDEWNEPAFRAQWEAEHRAEFDRQFELRIERLTAVARWWRLMLEGVTAPRGFRWRAWKSGRVENFLGRADL